MLLSPLLGGDGDTMANDIDAVIAALRVVLEEAERRETSWDISKVNNWIARLPGAWRGRWRHLKLRADHGRTAYRQSFVGHVRATIAYLESYRDAQPPIQSAMGHLAQQANAQERHPNAQQ